ncbi:hypothetical protein B0H12DRAFT_1155003 [Mycena haematopus]|nr:hypothetical protein B0H12DRAFT_1155003 [Mycena haematopus]
MKKAIERLKSVEDLKFFPSSQSKRDLTAVEASLDGLQSHLRNEPARDLRNLYFAEAHRLREDYRNLDARYKKNGKKDTSLKTSIRNLKQEVETIQKAYSDSSEIERREREAAERAREASIDRQEQMHERENEAWWDKEDARYVSTIDHVVSGRILITPLDISRHRSTCSAFRGYESSVPQRPPLSSYLASPPPEPRTWTTAWMRYPFEFSPPDPYPYRQWNNNSGAFSDPHNSTYQTNRGEGSSRGGRNW